MLGNDIHPESESETSSSTCPTVTINVRGFRFQLEKSWLLSLQGSPLTETLKRKGLNMDSDAAQVLFLNRDPFLFSAMLDYYVTGEIHVASDLCVVLLQRELAFWGLDESVLGPCCRLRFSEQHDLVRAMTLFMKEKAATDPRIVYAERQPDSETDSDTQPSTAAFSTMSRTFRIWLAMEGFSDNKWGRVYNIFIQIINISFVILTLLTTMPDFRHQMDEHHDDIDSALVRALKSTPNASSNASNWDIAYFKDMPVLQLIINTHAMQDLTFVEIGCTTILSLDIFVRFLLCPRRAAFCKDAFNFIGMLTIALLWTIFILTYIIVYIDKNHSPVSPTFLAAYYILQIFRLLRVISIFQVVRFYKDWKLIKWTMKASYNELGLLIALLFIWAILYGSLIYIAEIQLDTIMNLPQAIWWAFVTMTTVGYGDVAPKSAQGRVVGILCALSGILCIALPVPIIANNFDRFYKVLRLSHKLDSEEERMKERVKPCKQRRHDYEMVSV